MPASTDSANPADGARVDSGVVMSAATIGGALTDRPGSGDGSLRKRAARGVVVNGVSMVGVYSLSLIRGFVVAALLSPRDYGVWGVLAIALGAVLQLKQIGIADKYIAQSEPGQELAFQRAFTLELGASAVATVLMLASLPVIAAVFAQPSLIVPGAVLALAPMGAALQAPVWIFYRRMDYVRQRRLQAVDPLVGFVVTIALAATGAGYWSLIVGTVAGAWAGGIAALLASPISLALRYEAATARAYASFAWPLLLASLAPVVMAVVAAVAGAQVLGLAGVGLIVIAVSVSDYTNRVDAIVTETLYPAICAVRDRADLMLESFVKSNRLALMWGVPFGLGLTLFAPDLVSFVLGGRWRPGVHLLEAFGAIAAANHVAFNWDAFFRAHGRTRPIAVWSLATLAAFLMFALPLLIVDGLDGFAIGMAAMTVVSLAVRVLYLRQLLPGLRIVRHTVAAVMPIVPAVTIVLVARALETGTRSELAALIELVAYVALATLATFALERPLLREVAGYLRRAGEQGPPVGLPGASALPGSPV